MYVLVVTAENGVKKTFKSPFNCKDNTIYSLSPNILKGYSVDEYEKHGKDKNSFEYFGATVMQSKADGRKSHVKELPYFSFGFCYDNLKK